jgi:hypothetical protein
MALVHPRPAEVWGFALAVLSVTTLSAVLGWIATL